MFFILQSFFMRPLFRKFLACSSAEFFRSIKFSFAFFAVCSFSFNIKIKKILTFTSSWCKIFLFETKVKTPMIKGAVNL